MLKKIDEQQLGETVKMFDEIALREKKIDDAKVFAVDLMRNLLSRCLEPDQPGETVLFGMECPVKKCVKLLPCPDHDKPEEKYRCKYCGADKELEVMCATCGKDFPNLAVAEEHGRKTGHNIHG